MLREWEKKFPGRVESIFNALANVVPTHLLDRRLQDFGAVRATGAPDPDGDLAFDVDVALDAATEAMAAIEGVAAAPTVRIAPG
jgi:tRNA 2-thiocytidine biosynthesis protein TtcA